MFVDAKLTPRRALAVYMLSLSALAIAEAPRTVIGVWDRFNQVMP